ncbi:hypothetical protein K438DRAFT_1995441 [Mycena galopus ATCC 62051]|nr:hypothetical protein K438DRAFT_1995441 [Mycena galopus ATCC 62051]
MYRVLSEIPVPTAAHFFNDVVQLYSSAKDNVRDIKRSLSMAIFVGSPNASTAPAVDMGDVISSIAAPSGSFCFPHRAVLRETAENKRHYLEIWVGDVLVVSKDLTEAHELFYADEFFSALSFSPFELAFMYVAEANGPTEALEKFKFVPSIGEGQAGKKRPTIFIFRWDTSTIPCQTSLAIFSPLDKEKIYCTGHEYTRDGRLLGVRWCNNRPSGIWALTLPSVSEGTADSAVASLRCAAQKLKPSNLSCRSPRVYRDAAKNATLSWLSAASGGPHAGTFSLHASDLTAPQVKSQVLVDTTWQPRESDGFPALYLDSNLPASPFIIIHEEVSLVFSSTWGSRDTVLSVSAADGIVKDRVHAIFVTSLLRLTSGIFVTLMGTCELTRFHENKRNKRSNEVTKMATTLKDLTPDSDGKLYSWTMLATDGNSRLVCSRSAPTIPHEIVLGEVNSRGEASWRVIHSPYILPSLKTALSDLTYSVVSIPGRRRTETVFVGRSRPEPTPPPCIQFIHGGPHGVTTTAFVPSIAFLALEGYTISSPNYTGSVGFGETAIRALLGNCGTLDVQDCIVAVRHLVSIGLSVEGKGKQFLIGGSHGGFLAAHLIGQFPDMFTATVIRNPVITTDPMSSDIPDWYFNEWNIDYPMSSAPEGYPAATNGDRSLPPRRTPAESQRILSSSSMEYVDAVTAHVLLHLGGADLRVTPTHGLEYYHALKEKARNERPEQGVEKEDHSLAGVEASRISISASAAPAAVLFACSATQSLSSLAFLLELGCTGPRTTADTETETIEINDAMFCKHFKEVCTDCDLDVCKENDAFDPVVRKGIDAPPATVTTEGTYQCKKHASMTSPPSPSFLTCIACWPVPTQHSLSLSASLSPAVVPHCLRPRSSFSLSIVPLLALPLIPHLLSSLLHLYDYIPASAPPRAWPSVDAFSAALCHPSLAPLFLPPVPPRPTIPAFIILVYTVPHYLLSSTFSLPGRRLTPVPRSLQPMLRLEEADRARAPPRRRQGRSSASRVVPVTYSPQLLDGYEGADHVTLFNMRASSLRFTCLIPLPRVFALYSPGQVPSPLLLHSVSLNPNPTPYIIHRANYSFFPHCTDCDFDGREENDAFFGFDPIDRESIDAPPG